MSNSDTYSRSARILHWGMAALILSLLFAGLSMIQSMQPWHLTLLGLHKSFGVVALLAVTVRLFVRLTNKVPPLPPSVPGWQQRIARFSHILLYLAMFAMPLSGYLMQNAAGRPVDVFGLFTLPTLLPLNLELYAIFRELHFITAWALILLVLVHIGAALHHGLIKKDGVLQAMTGTKGRSDS